MFSAPDRSPARTPGRVRISDGLSAAQRDELKAEREADRFHDECGVFGIHGNEEASNIVYLGLYALQHRGQESCGIVSSNGREHIACTPDDFFPAVGGPR